MPAKASDKCRQCSKLSAKSVIAQARTQGFALHGTEGNVCWAGESCHKRRTYYKNAIYITATVASSIMAKRNLWHN